MATDQQPKPQTLFTNVQVFDGENEKRIENANVLIEGNLIKEISTKKITANGTEKVIPLAKKIGVKMAFGTFNG